VATKGNEMHIYLKIWAKVIQLSDVEHEPLVKKKKNNEMSLIRKYYENVSLKFKTISSGHAYD
jgi:hypothetical protein